jgi:tetratricopeptide (TPR) repeat protein
MLQRLRSRSSLISKRTSFWVLFLICFFPLSILQAQPVLPGNPPFFQNPNSEKLIIFVHGLTGDPVKTWSSDDDSPFFWPEQLAKDADFKNADVLSFGYKTDCGVTFNIRQIAEKLETTLIQLDWINRYQSVSFVAHSLGGLVTRQFILNHHEKTNIDSVVLLSSPNFGNHLTKLPGLFCDSAHLKELNPGGYIDILNDNWRRVFKENRDKEPFHFSAGYELAPTYKLIKVGIIVDKNAAVNFASHTRGFLKDHSHIAKPNGRDDFLYIWTKQRLLRKAPEPGNQYTEAEEKRFEEVIDSLQKELKGTDLEKALNLIAKGQLNEALALLSAHEKKDDEKILKIAKARFAKAQVYELQLKYKNALKYYEKAVQLAPENSKYLNAAGLIFNTLADYEKAIGYYEKALASDLKTFGPKHPKVAIRWNNLGGAWHSKGNTDKAIEYFNLALASDLKTFGPEHPKVAKDWSNLGVAWEKKGKYDKAIGYYEKALESDLKTFRPEHPNVATDWNNLGVAWARKGNTDKAIEYHEKALASDLKTFGPQHFNVARVWNNLGFAWDRKGNYDKAIKYYGKAREIFIKFGQDHNVAVVEGNLASARRKKDEQK